jgi:hypothetical protein
LTACSADFDGNTNLEARTIAVDILAADSGASQLATSSIAGALQNTLANTLAGVATFPHLVITSSGQNLLRFSSSTIPSPALSQVFTVAAASPVGIAVTRQPGPAINGYPMSLAPFVDIVDVFANPCPSPSDPTTVTAVLRSNPSQATLDCGSGALLCLRLANAQGLGRAIFDPMSINNPGEGFTLFFSASLVKPDGSIQVVNTTSRPFNITGWQAALRIDRQPTVGRCGEALQTSVLVSVLDSQHHLVVAVIGTLSARITKYPGVGTPVLLGTTTVAIVQGVALFSDLRIDRSGSGYTLTFSLGSLSVQSSAFRITGGKADSLRIQNFTSQVAAAQLFTCVLATFDACDNIVPESFVLNAQLLLSSSMTLVPYPVLSPPGPGSYMDGIAVVAFSVNTANIGYRINFTATSSTIGTKIVTSPSFNISIGIISRLLLDSVPTGGISSIPLEPSIVKGIDGGDNLIPDLAGQITVRKFSGDTLLSTLSGTTRVGVARGTATFADLTLSGADGDLVLEFAYTADDNSPPQLAVRAAPVVVTGPTARIRLVNIAMGAFGGQPFSTQPVLSGVDYLSRVVRAPLIITASVSNGANFTDSLQGNCVLRSSVDGLVQFTDLSLMTAGSRSLVFTSGLLTVSQTLEVAIGEAYKLIVTAQPPSAVLVNTIFPQAPAVAVLDLGNNVVSSRRFLFTVAIGANRHAAQLSGTTSFQGLGGVASFPGLSIDTAGVGYSLYFHADSSILSAYSTYFEVQGPISAIKVKYFVPGGFSNEPLAPAIQIAAVDSSWNMRTYNNPNEITSCYVAGISPSNFMATATAKPIIQGVARLDDIKINTLGSGIQLRFRCDVSSGGQTDSFFCFSPFFTLIGIPSSASIRILPAAQLPGSQLCGPGTTDQRRLYCAPSSLVTKLGQIIQPAINVEIWSDTTTPPRLLIGLNGRVQVDLIPYSSNLDTQTDIIPGGVIGNTTGQLSAGKSSFPSLFANYSGSNVVLRFRLTSSISSVQPSYLFIPSIGVGDPRSIVLQVQPVFDSPGKPFLVQPCLIVQDVGGNWLQNLISSQAYPISVSVVQEGLGGPELNGTAMLNALFGTVAFTDLYLSSARVGTNISLRFSSSNLQVTSQPFLVQAGAPALVQIVTMPSFALISNEILNPPPMVQVFDLQGNSVEAGYLVFFYLTSLDTMIDDAAQSFIVNQSATQEPLRNGRATFKGLSISSAGSYTAAFLCGGILSVSTPVITVSPGQAVRLLFSVQPTSNVQGVTFSPPIQALVVDVGGNWVDYNQTATVSIIPGSASILGDVNATFIMGIAFFQQLSVDRAGNDFRLVLSSIGLQSAVSNAFNITGPPDIIRVDGPTYLLGYSMAPLYPQPSIRLFDVLGNPIDCPKCSGGTVVASVDNRSAGAVLLGNTAAIVFNGRATFTNLAVDKAGNFSLSYQFFQTPSLTPIFYSGLSKVQIIYGPPKSLRFVATMDSHLRGVPPGRQATIGILDSAGNTVANCSQPVFAELKRGSNATSAVLLGNTRIYLHQGMANFTDLSVLPASPFVAFYVISFSTLGIYIDTNLMTVLPGPVSLVKLSDSSSVFGGISNINNGLLTPQPQVLVCDQGGGVVTGFDGSGCNGISCVLGVSILSGPVNGSLLGSTSLLANSGIITFTNLRLPFSGIYSLRFATVSFGGQPAVFLDVSDIQVAVPSLLEVLQDPGGAMAGLPLRRQPVVQVSSAPGVRLIAATYQMNVSLDAACGCQGLSGTLSVNAINGKTTYTDLRVASAAILPCRFIFSILNSGVALSVSSAAFKVMQSEVVLKIRTQPSNSSGGIPFSVQPSLALVDQAGNSADNFSFYDRVSVTARESSFGREVFVGGTLNVLPVLGTANFTDLYLNSPGTFFLSFVQGLVTIDSSIFVVSEGTLTSLALSMSASYAQVSIVVTPPPSITALDSGNNTVRSLVGQVAAASVQAQNSPFGNTVSVGTGSFLLNGTAVFASLLIPISGRGIRITFSFGAVSVDSAGIDVHGPPTQISLYDFPVSVNSSPNSAGTPITPYPTVWFLDGDGIQCRIATGNNTVVELYQIPSATYQSSDMTLRSLASGTTARGLQYGLARFDDLVIRSSGLYVLRFLNAALSVVSPPFTVSNGDFDHLQFAQRPDPIQTGSILLVPFPSVQAFDAFDNVVINPPIAVRACVADSASSRLCADRDAYLDGTANVSTAANGLAIFSNLTVRPLTNVTEAILTTFSVTLLFSSLLDDGSIASVNTSFILMPGSQRLVITSTPALARYGQVFTTSPTIQVMGAGNFLFSNLNYIQVFVTLASATVYGTTPDATARLMQAQTPCPVAGCAARLSNGTATWAGLWVDTPGASYRLLFSAPGLMGVAPVFSPFFAVSGGPFVARIVATSPGVVTTAQEFAVAASALDAGQLPVPIAWMAVALLIDGCQSAAAVQLVGRTNVSAVTGTAAFTDLRVTRACAAAQLRFFWDPADGGDAGAAASVPFLVTSREPNGILAQTSLTGLLGGTVVGVSLQVVDNQGDLVQRYNGSIQLDAILMGSSVNSYVAIANGGVANFNLTMATAATGYTLRYRIGTGTSLLTQFSSPFDVSVGPIAALTISVPPADTVAGSPFPFSPKILAVDAGGNTIPNFAGLISASKATGQVPQSSLAGAASIRTVAGVAIFDRLWLTQADPLVTLRFYTPQGNARRCGLDVTSQSFAVTSSPKSLVLVTTPGGAYGGKAFTVQPLLRVVDAVGVTVRAGLVCRVDVAILFLAGRQQKGTLTGNSTAVVNQGQAAFTDLGTVRLHLNSSLE